MRPRFAALALAALGLTAAFVGPAGAFAADPGVLKEAPAGFTALFNGKDLDRLARHAPLRPAQARRDERRGRAAKKIAEWTEDAKKHWTRRGRRARQRRPRRLPDDRQGLRRHRAADRLQDRPQGRQRHLPPRHAAGPDLGLHQGGRQVGPSAPTRARAASGTTAPARPGKDPLVLADKPFGEWNHFRIIQVGARTTVYLNDKLVVDHATDGELLGPQAAAVRPRARSSSRPTAARSAGGTSSSARSPPTRPTRSSPSTAARASRRSSTARTSTAGPARSRTTRSSTARSAASRSKGGVIYYNKELSRLRRPRRVQAPARRQQRPGDPLPRQGRHRLRRACASSRCSTTRADKYAKLDPRQAHGSAYGMVAAAARLPPAGRRVELRGSDGQGLEDQGRAQRHRDPRRRPEQGHGVHGQHAPPRQGPHLRLLRLRRPQRPGRVPQRRDQDARLSYYPGTKEPHTSPTRSEGSSPQIPRWRVGLV